MELPVAGAGPLSVAIIALVAAVSFVVALALVLIRRSVAWTATAAAAVGAAVYAFVRYRGGVTSAREDAVAVAILSALGAIAGAAPVAFAAWFTRWARRVSRDAEHRVIAQR